jgi:hypothetical protein
VLSRVRGLTHDSPDQNRVSESHSVGRWLGMVRCRCRAGEVCPDRACRSLWRPHDSDRPTRPGAGNATRYRTGRGTGMSSSTLSSTPPVPQTRRRRPAGEVVLGVDTQSGQEVGSREAAREVFHLVKQLQSGPRS